MSTEEKKNVVLPKNTADFQRRKIEKLMKKDKPVFIPNYSKEHKPRDPLEFIRNVWGSSAGAGSGDFHVYRGVRRREYARQKYMNEKSAKDEADAEYQKKVEENKKAADDRTAKKRAKRLKKKQKGKKPKIDKPVTDTESEEESGKEDDIVKDQIDYKTNEKDQS